ncbi:MAG TPA: ferredoxin family protein [Methylomirabilota bacterium]|nr:ferredoxin family protein [Methylomirabilota bacterium]
MTYVITQPCIGVKDGSCIDVCPMDCIHGTEQDHMLYIDPEECIDCNGCVPVCPVDAIFPEAEVPEKWQHFTQANADYFKNKK